jgi:hypothetical protein
MDVAAATFSLSPALVNTSVIDYNTTAGAKLYTAATHKLTTEYDLSSDGVKLFLKQLGDPVLFSGWTDILNIPKVPGAEAVFIEHDQVPCQGLPGRRSCMSSLKPNPRFHDQPTTPKPLGPRTRLDLQTWPAYHETDEDVPPVFAGERCLRSGGGRIPNGTKPWLTSSWLVR